MVLLVVVALLLVMMVFLVSVRIDDEIGRPKLVVNIFAASNRIRAVALSLYTIGAVLRIPARRGLV